jgi:hypothetical protein
MLRHKQLHTSWNYEQFENVFIASSVSYQYHDKLFWVNEIKDCYGDEEWSENWTYFSESIEQIGSVKVGKRAFVCQISIQEFNSQLENHEANEGEYLMYFTYKNQIYSSIIHKIRLSDSGLFLEFRPDEMCGIGEKDKGVDVYLREINRRCRLKKLKYYFGDAC